MDVVSEKIMRALKLHGLTQIQLLSTVPEGRATIDWLVQKRVIEQYVNKSGQFSYRLHSTDNLTRKQRSYTMSRIRSKWTKPEKIIHALLKTHKIRHKMHPKIKGSPDILLEGKKVVFLQGCFWHGCPKHYKPPASNKEYWIKKIKANVKRDRKTTKQLQLNGYKVIKIWEHNIKKNPKAVLNKIVEK